MKKKNLNLVVGVVIFTSLFILIAGVLWLKEVNVSRKMNRYTILFPNIGTLQSGDPVTVCGVKKGVVTNLYLYKSRVAVVIKLDNKVFITDSSKITVQNIGLMGERMVGIQLSEKGKPCKPDSEEKVIFIKGYFDSGIAEAMGMLGSVLDDVEALADTAQKIIRRTVGNPDFVAFFHSFIDRIDTIVAMIDDLVKDNEENINSAIRDVRTISKDIKKLINSNSADIKKVVSNSSELSDAALVIAERLDSVIISVNNIVTGIESGEGSIGMLVNDETLIKDLHKTAKNLDSLVRDIKEDALKLRVKIFGNKKYFKENEEKN